MIEYTEETLRKVKNFGFLQYGIEKIISILNPESPAQFKIDITDEGHPLSVMYKSGLNTGQYNLDAVEFELKRAEVDAKKQQISNDKMVDQMVDEYLGYDS
jgi:hypothetical protein